ncbi:uncharacterized protein LY89DRAFT_301161 [Mollisia scopiformis]|uniref:Uncharacterized protein n=1 Tax=Mollisia scopiformis TaxID=149040 RepID=A0A194XS00_MOLSC|nr:uncharacterized protein LY89DRAFT_301161 [Mollisia scopiformis]KUJ22502.1 hypothetical protein LY89DRAFT_301161 [Mollisia scopiformis]
MLLFNAWRQLIRWQGWGWTHGERKLRRGSSLTVATVQMPLVRDPRRPLLFLVARSNPTTSILPFPCAFIPCSPAGPASKARSPVQPNPSQAKPDAAPNEGKGRGEEGEGFFALPILNIISPIGPFFPQQHQ